MTNQTINFTVAFTLITKNKFLMIAFIAFLYKMEQGISQETTYIYRVTLLLLFHCVLRYKLIDIMPQKQKVDQCYKSPFSCRLVSATFSPGLNAGIPKYGQLAHRNASPK